MASRTRLDDAGIMDKYSRVTLTLGTHDASGLTERDFRLAEKIDA